MSYRKQTQKDNNRVLKREPSLLNKMKHKTYETIYQAHLGNVDKKALLEARFEETDPFYRYVIDFLLDHKHLSIPWSITPFTSDFRKGSPRDRLDETTLAFILRLVALHKEEQYFRAYRKPETFDAVMAWESMVRNVIVCTLALLYDVRWTPQTLMAILEPSVLILLTQGDPLALRQLMQSVGINMARQTPYPAERDFEKLHLLHVYQHSSFYWRYLHWMAEACHLRKDPAQAFYKQLWLEQVQGSLYRTLRCGICMYHFRNMVTELKPKLLDPETDAPKLWFDMHNRVHALRREQYMLVNEPDYTESEYEADRAFMHRALTEK